MANKIQFRRGLKANLPILSVGEPALTTDTNELFIGGSSGNINVSTSGNNKIQTANGTGTSITLNNITLENGFIVTFVVAANNNGAATTINGKNLYKPNTTQTPTLTAGKAITVWYNGTHFFTKASTEGNAVAGDVLAGKTFSNDNDTGLVGTIPVHQYDTPPKYYGSNIGEIMVTPEPGYYGNNSSILITEPSLTSENIKYNEYIIDINGSFTSDGTAVANEILSGKVAYVKGNKVTGTMTNRGAVNQALAINGNYTIPEGYHNGSGKITQSITTKAAQTYIPGTANQTITSGQYLSGAQTILGDSNLNPANIKSGVSIFGKVGTFTSDATALASNIASGKSAYVNGNKITGTYVPPIQYANGMGTNSGYQYMKFYIIEDNVYIDAYTAYLEVSGLSFMPNYVWLEYLDENGVGVIGLPPSKHDGFSFKTYAYDGVTVAYYEPAFNTFKCQYTPTGFKINYVRYSQPPTTLVKWHAFKLPIESEWATIY